MACGRWLLAPGKHFWLHRIVEAFSDERYDLGRYVGWRRDMEDWLANHRLQRDILPSRIAVLWLVQDNRSSAIKKLTRGTFEIWGRGVEDSQVQVRAQKLQNAVRLANYVLGARQFLTKGRHRFGQSALLGANPPDAGCAGGKEARCVGVSLRILFFGDGPGVVAGGAIASLAISRADSMAVLRDLEGGPAKLGQGCDQASNN